VGVVNYYVGLFELVVLYQDAAEVGLGVLVGFGGELGAGYLGLDYRGVEVDSSSGRGFLGIFKYVQSFFLSIRDNETYSLYFSPANRACNNPMSKHAETKKRK
jgi:hypothetical protein